MPTRLTRRPPRLAPPDLTPFAGVMLALSCFFVLLYYPAEPRPGLVALRETPLIGCQACFNVPEHTRILVCLTTDGRLSFTASDAGLQVAALRRAAGRSSPQILTETQLLTCIATARTLSPAMTGLPAYLYLVIDADASSTAVMQLLHLLQQQHLNRLNLLAHCRA